MNKIFTYLVLLFVGISPLLAQTASILPNAITQFFDNNGNPLSGGSVTTYIPGTTSNKTTWQDAGETIVNANPVILDAGGKAKIWGQGTYREIVKDALGNIIWDAVTVTAGSGGGGGAIGDGLLVGSILPWSGVTAPNQYLFAAGQAILRNSFSFLMTAITQTSNVVCTFGSTTLTGMSDTTQIPIGAPVEVSCVTPGTTVVSKTSSSVTLTNPSNISINASAVFFPYGNGDGSTTFNIPDLRGYVIAGNNNMTGSASSRLTSTFFGSNPNATGAAGGSQSDTFNLTQANLPNITLTTVIPSGQGAHNHTLSGVLGANFIGNQGSGGGNIAGNGGNTVGTSTLPAMSGTTSLGGSGIGITLSTIQPTFTLNYIIKVTPDTNGSLTSGVTSIGGMEGIIACGSGLLCTGNNVSVIPSSTNNITVGTTAILGGTSGNCLYDNLGFIGEQICSPGTVSSIVIGSGLSSTQSPLTTTGTLSIANTSVTSGTYGNSTTIPSFTVNAQGQLTNAINNSLLASNLGGTTLASNVVTSSLTSVGTLISGATGSGFIIDFSTSSVNSQLLVINGGTGASTFTANRPLIGNGTSAITQGTLSGNTTTFATTSGTLTSGNCVQIDANGNFIGVTCTGGGGTVSTGSTGQLTYYSTTGTTVSGNINANISNGSLTLGIANTTIGKLILEGNTSGALTITPQATAGTPTWTAGTNNGTPVVTASSPLNITTATGNLTITGVVGQILAGATPAFTATPTLGVAGTTLGTLSLTGNTSGTVVLTPQAVAGSVILTFPNTSGTIADGASSPIVLSSTTGNLTCPTCATTTSGGAISGTSPISVSSGGAISITGANGQILAGSGPIFTATPTLGASGTLGTLSFGNATSGTITLQPVTGVLGTVTASLPANTGTLAELNLSQTWTASQTFSPTTNFTSFFTTSSTITATNILDGGNITISGNILNFPGVILRGNGTFTLGSTILYGAPGTAPASQIAYGGTVASASNCGSLASSAGCVVINVGGTQRYIPYY